jgi:NADH-quinone oxidoreductase subunit C
MTPEEVGTRLVGLLEPAGTPGAVAALPAAPVEQAAPTGPPEEPAGAAVEADGPATPAPPAPTPPASAQTARPAGARGAAARRPAKAAAGATAPVALIPAGDRVASSTSGGGAWARATVDVPPQRWREAAREARDDAGPDGAGLDCDYFDWLSAVDELEAGFTIVAHLWSTRRRHGVLLRTRVPREAPSVPSIVDIYPGAAWHERETYEMFGIDFAGHENLRPLLLPPEFEGHPLRKEFVLAARVAKDWPGAKEPGESHDPTATRRQKMRPPGVPDPTEWGPAAHRRGEE